jgi:hypothetical protein
MISCAGHSGTERFKLLESRKGLLVDRMASRWFTSPVVPDIIDEVSECGRERNIERERDCR